MNFFEEATLRLKQQLGMTQDQEVAKMLEMTPRAWAGRKKTESFPETEVLALSARRPELGLNVDYVLTGKWPEDVRQDLARAKQLGGDAKQQSDARIAQAVALLHACTSTELDTLVKGVLAMGNEMMRQRGFRMPGVTTWHANDVPASVPSTENVEPPRKKSV